ncbi:jg6899 [Pararge aegeria aegeria]|uniref:Jg6899 protein n=2 Tax=Pararge aegeria aegeria TaxID=348720 RepID=A0A8S4QVM6_9NEOP|nr:jg6899 [Pararge aegeria aegeria]
MDLESIWCDWDDEELHKGSCTDKFRSYEALLQKDERAPAREKKMSRIERHTSEIADFECDWGIFPEVEKNWGRRREKAERSPNNFELLAIKMAIVDTEYPEVFLKQEMVWPLQSAIFSMIFTKCKPFIKIGISNVIDGTLRVNCFGTAAVEWLKTLQGMTVEGVTLKVVEGSECKKVFSGKSPYNRLIKMAVVSDKHPVVSIEDHMVPTIQGLINTITDTNNTPKSSINITQIVGGALHVDCKGRNSVERLRDLDGKSVEEGIKLKVVNSKYLPTSVKMIWITKLHLTDTAKMLKYLQRWNKKLRICDWKIVYTYICGSYLRRVILMDVASANVIKAANYNLYAGVDFTRFRLCESNRSPAFASDLNVEGGDTTLHKSLDTSLLRQEQKLECPKQKSLYPPKICSTLVHTSDVASAKENKTAYYNLYPLVDLKPSRPYESKSTPACLSDLEIEGVDTTSHTPLDTPLLTEEQIFKSSSDYKRLSGAGRKRLWKLVKDEGLDLQEALILARKPLKEPFLSNPELEHNLKGGRLEEQCTKQETNNPPKMYAIPKGYTLVHPSDVASANVAKSANCNLYGVDLKQASTGDLKVEGGESTLYTALDTPLQTKEQIFKSSSNYKRLSGARRRRLWKLVKDEDLDLQEALLLTRIPSKEPLLSNPELEHNLKGGRLEEECTKQETNNPPKIYAIPQHPSDVASNVAKSAKCNFYAGVDLTQASTGDLKLEGGESTLYTPLVTPLLTEEQIFKSSSDYKRLSRARRRRLWKLVKDDCLDLQEALLLAREPSKEA